MIKKLVENGKGVNDLDLAPDFYIPNLEEIDFDQLTKMGIHSYIIDWDQTICDKYGEVSRRNAYALQKAVDGGAIQNIVILTNSLPTDRKTKEEAIRFKMEEMIGVPIRKILCLGLFDRKPKAIGFKMALEEFSCGPEEVAVIGDQLISDIKGAKRIGALTILIDPVGPYGWRTVLSMRYFRNRWVKRRLGLRYTSMTQTRKESS